MLANFAKDWEIVPQTNELLSDAKADIFNTDSKIYLNL